MPRQRLLLLGKATDPYFAQAVAVAEREVELTSVAGTRTDPLPPAALDWQGEVIVSYLSPWIVPPALLARATTAAINLHPGPPAYPGIGCTNFALYAGEREYGVTAHHMHLRVDTGPVIAVRRFPILPNDSVLTLTRRCHAAIAVLFAELLAPIVRGEPLPEAGERWTRAAFRRAELDALCELRWDMPDEEVRRRIRATTYPGMPGPYVTVDGAARPVADLAQFAALRAAATARAER